MLHTVKKAPAFLCGWGWGVFFREPEGLVYISKWVGLDNKNSLKGRALFQNFSISLKSQNNYTFMSWES